MKVSFLLTFFTALNVSAALYSQDARMTLDVQEKSVLEVIRMIEKQSQFRFFFSDNYQDLNKLVTLRAKDENLSEILENMLSDKAITYKILENNIVVITPIDFEFQQQKISGTITDATNGEPIIGANVIIEGTTQGTVTDAEGKFSIEVSDINAVIVVSYLGYNSERIQLDGRSIFDIKLIPDIKKLEEVVVIGYGSRSRKDVTTSISTIDSKSISESVAMSPEMIMQGRMTGVNVAGNTGNPMDRPVVRIRGVNTWGVAEPLYVIDGVPITELGAGIEGSEDARVNDVRGPVNIMTMIDPNDIESISVLKDASSAAIYGVRASNGVILITTKKGKSDKPIVEFNSRYGVQNIVKKWDVLNTQQYVEYYKKAYAANPNQILDPQYDPNSPLYLGNTQETYDWQSPLLMKMPGHKNIQSGSLEKHPKPIIIPLVVLLQLKVC